ncbi:uncharacterized protein LOC113663393 isoform X1 [Tachysurus fulvidraco]|uniref:uncharacterized protein LOC113663393 isoform X1 n=1 Tax=Tachysurus fulvidraco TaxID=1234273 RepID=UPI000F4D78F7|nr:uncharacterized protein LOC113663393 isoform X1 [Tachysurus fulvidraco]XP_027034472.1 uncharacterized protein LOC113663393 isoform X1 [Tachysurus fulvidraco]XP_027034473.1 uncharacterized protein LOC113663393 isoform X1 [Tachysurus fulvidraco]
MELQKFILLILVGVFSSTLVIVIVFIIINMCVRGKAAKYVATSENPTKSSFEMSNSFKLNGQEDIRPPLPSREQFDTESMSNSYEEMPEIPMVAVETSSLQNPVHSHVPQTHTNLLDNASISESYDDVDELQSVNSYEEMTEIPMVAVETSSQNPVHSHVPQTHTNLLDNASNSESYDDIDEIQRVNSYEEMTEIPMVAVETSSLQNPVHSHVPQTHTNLLDNASISESYDDIEELQRVQGISVASLPDYLDVDPPPFINGSNNGSNNVSENYDDDQLQCDSEDYDDVG